MRKFKEFLVEFNDYAGPFLFCVSMLYGLLVVGLLIKY